MQVETITIIGLGRTGVSLALALKRSSLALTVVGSDLDAERIQVAKKIASALDKTIADTARAAAMADIVVLAVPADVQQEALAMVGPVLKPHALLLDLGGLKRPSRAWADKALVDGHYIAAAPVLTYGALLDGREPMLSARADLFANSVWALMPAADADPEAVKTAVQFGQLLGATPFFLDAEEYDSLMQGVEALPGLVAAALFRAVARADGWRDLARLAGQPFTQMIAPLEEATAVAAQLRLDPQAGLRWLDAAIAELQHIRAWVAEDEPELLAARLQSLAEEIAAWQQQRVDQQWHKVDLVPVKLGAVGGHMLGRAGGDESR